MTKFSMPNWATSRNRGNSTKLTEAQISGFAIGWARLMDTLGPIARHIEVMRVDPWTFSNSEYVVYDVYFVLSMYKETEKIECKVHLDFGRDIKTIETDPEQIAKFLCNIAPSRIKSAIQGQADHLTTHAFSWQNLITPKAE